MHKCFIFFYNIPECIKDAQKFNLRVFPADFVAMLRMDLP